MQTDTLKLFDAVQQAMAGGKPLAKYKKVTLGKIAINIIDPISGRPENVILEGDPNKNEDSCFVTFWTPVELAYFEKANKYQLIHGHLVPYTTTEEPTDNRNQITDEELKDALATKFFAVKSLLDRFTSPTPVKRLLELATEMNKPVGTINAITARLAELQAKEYETE